MKYALLFSICFSLFLPAFSRCMSNGIFISNTTTIINKNGFIILEFYGNSQTLVPELNNKFPVYLKSKEGKTTLVIKQVNKGYHLTQLILVPEAPLNELFAYEFHIDKLPKEERQLVWGNIRRLYDKKKIIFTVTNESQKAIPYFIQAPIELKKTFVRYGCGPEKWVYFGIALSDTSNNLIKVSVKSKLDGQIAEYILPVENGIVKVGHGMCSGAFDFKEEVYEVVFSILDVSGKEAEKTEPVIFSAPVATINKEQAKFFSPLP